MWTADNRPRYNRDKLRVGEGALDDLGAQLILWRPPNSRVPMRNGPRISSR